MICVHNLSVSRVPHLFLCRFFSLLRADFTVAWYIILFCKQLPFKGQSFFALKLRWVWFVWVVCWLFFCWVFFFNYLCHVLKYNCSWFLLCFSWISCGECLMGGGEVVYEFNENFSYTYFCFCCMVGWTRWCFFFLFAFFVLCVVYLSRKFTIF